MVETIIILIIILGISLYVNFNLFSKNEKMEATLDEHYNIMRNIKNLIKESSERIEALDKNGAFKSDDEIGFFFKTVKLIQDILSDLVETQPKIK